MASESQTSRDSDTKEDFVDEVFGDASVRHRESVQVDDTDVKHRFFVTKDRPVFATGTTTKYLEVMVDGTVRIRDAKLSRLDRVVQDPLSFFADLGKDSEKVSMLHEKKKRAFKFSTLVEKDNFFNLLRKLKDRRKLEKKTRHTLRSFKYLPAEVMVFPMTDVVVSRVGSDETFEGNLAAITNFRMVVVDAMGKKVISKNLENGDQVIPGVEVIHMCVNDLQVVADVVTVSTKDFKTVVVDLSGVKNPNWRQQSIDFMKKYMLPTSPRDVFAFAEWYGRGVRDIRQRRSTQRTPRAADSAGTNNTASFSIIPRGGISSGATTPGTEVVESEEKELLFDNLKLSRFGESHKRQLMLAEYERLGHVEDGAGCPFRLTELNRGHQLCSTYPEVLMVPKTASDQLITEAANYRSRHRLPVIVWSNRKNVTISRCSQPEQGVFGKQSSADESLIQLINDLNPNNDSFVICDCRPKVNAVANRFKGKGFEGDSYAQAHLMFFDIQNIHAMRGSITALKKCCENQLDSNWLSALNDTKYFQHLTKILQCARRVANYVDKDKCSVLVHCSDGWDRTAQVCALAELLLDSYYRRFKGFQILVQKEWLWFGHKFADRNGNFGPDGIAKSKKERSPIFIQFLDCVFQIMTQFPWAFEFTTDLVLELAEHVSSGRFGDFLCNCDRERDEMQLWLRTPSLWKHLDDLWEKQTFRNHTYVPTHRVLKPRYAVRDVVLWDDLYCRFTVHNKDRRLLSKNHMLTVTDYLNGSHFSTFTPVPMVMSRREQRKEEEEAGGPVSVASAQEELSSADDTPAEVASIRRLESRVRELELMLSECKCQALPPPPSPTLSAASMASAMSPTAADKNDMALDYGAFGNVV